MTLKNASTGLERTNPFGAFLDQVRKAKNMEKYLYEAILTPNELGGYDVVFPTLGIITQGDTVSDAAFMAQDLLATWIASLLKDGEEVAQVDTFGHDTPDGAISLGIVVCVDESSASDDYMTVQEAADVLDVSTPRIYAMVRDGVLSSEKVGTSRMISAADVMDYFNNPRSSGRPKRVATV